MSQPSGWGGQRIKDGHSVDAMRERRWEQAVTSCWWTTSSIYISKIRSDQKGLDVWRHAELVKGLRGSGHERFGDLEGRWTSDVIERRGPF
jgi:hypothetical protein